MTNRSFLEQCLLLLFSLGLFAPVSAQSPGGITGQGLWQHSEDSTYLISNYKTLNLHTFESAARVQLEEIPNSSSLFFVFQGNFGVSVEDTLLQIGDVTLTDGGMYHGKGFTSIDFTDSFSKIISVQTVRGFRMARDTAPEIKIGDVSKFSLAEVVYYPFALNRAQRRMVNSYLSLKYAIPILSGIEKDWKDYWAKDSSFYWDANKDKGFYVRVMGLGADAGQSFYQTQSIAETGGHFSIALDTSKTPGNMPRTWVAQEGFLVFSERLPSPIQSLGSCSNIRVGLNPLERWKFKATDAWRTWANTLVIDIQKPNGAIADSIFYTDGIHFYYTPWVYQDAQFIRYEVDLSNVVTGTNYMFTKRSSVTQNCNQLEVTSVGSGISFVGAHGKIYVHSFDTGVTFESDEYTSSELALSEGQYHVVLYEKSGMEVYNELVAVDKRSIPTTRQTNHPTMRMYPNPALTGGVVQVELIGFNEKVFTWQLVDALGRVAQEGESYRKSTAISFNAPSMEGTYTFRVITPQGVYSLKLIAVQR
jgi:hypothetical protein